MVNNVKNVNNIDFLTYAFSKIYTSGTALRV